MAVILAGVILVSMINVTGLESYAGQAIVAGDFTYINNGDGTGSINSYTGRDTEVVIPETINGSRITEIGEMAFKRHAGLTSVVIPSNVTKIGLGAFQECSSLTSINIPSNVTYIGNSAFLGCSSLTNVTIPESVTDIKGGAFSGCSSLTSINIPSGITYMHQNMFKGCSSISSIEIPSGVTTVGVGVFKDCSSLTSVEIPSSVTYLGNWAFQGCSNLTSIKIPSSVTKIEEGVFEGCDKLVIFCETGSCAQKYAETNNISCRPLEQWGQECTHDNTELRDVTEAGCITEGYTGNTYCTACGRRISEGRVVPALDHCYTGAVTKEPTLRTEGEKTYTCTRCNHTYTEVMARLTTPETDFKYQEKTDGTIVVTGYKADNTDMVVIPGTINGKKVTSIGESAFVGHYELTSVEIPSGVTSIGESVFENCANLESVNIPASVTEIGNSAFAYCNSITSIEIPLGVTSIGNNVFEHCVNLTSVNIPASVTKIGYEAFINCSSLTSIEIPSSVVSIGERAFVSCSKLKGIKIPSSVTSIGNNAFAVCEKLVICCEENSAARQYAMDNKIPYKSFEAWGQLICVHDNMSMCERVEATCNKTGNEEYWICNGCGKMFLDENADTEIDSIPVLNALGHEYELCAITSDDGTSGSVVFTCKRENCKENDTGHCETVTITAPDKATLVFDGNAKEATVSCSSKNVPENTPEIVYTGKNLTNGKPVNAGTYTASITIGTGADAVSASVTYEIAQIELTVTGATAKDRPYDGVSDKVDISAVSISGVRDGEDVAVDLTGLQGTLGSVKAGSYTEVTLPELTLTGKDAANYKLVLPSGTVTLSDSVTISKKDAQITGNTIKRKYLFLRENKEVINLKDLLPEDCENVTYGNPAISGDITYSVAPKIEDGVLTYTVDKGTVGNAGTIQVQVVTDNYTDITITIHTELMDQIPTVLQSGTTIQLKKSVLTYGETISRLEFSDALFVEKDGKRVAGTLAWKNPDSMPDTGTTSAAWIFTPDREEYAPAEGEITIKVQRANPQVIELPTTADRIYDSSNTLVDSILTGGKVTGVDGNVLAGTWSWKNMEEVPAVGNHGYTAVFTPEDTANYEIVETKITIRVNEAPVEPTPDPGTTPTPDPGTTPTPDPGTTPTPDPGTTPTPDPGATVTAGGVYVVSHTRNQIVVGLVTNRSQDVDVEYRWLVCDTSVDAESWTEIQGWTKNNEWLDWKPGKAGDYVIVGQARVAGNENSLTQSAIGIQHHQEIKGKCQMPYTGEGGGYLMGFETFDNPDAGYTYEMLVLDCTLLAQGKDAWIWTTGRCQISGNAFWAVWQPQYGYYWTLFRVYDKNGTLLDQECYPFVNAY